MSAPLPASSNRASRGIGLLLYLFLLLASFPARATVVLGYFEGQTDGLLTLVKSENDTMMASVSALSGESRLYFAYDTHLAPEPIVSVGSIDTAAYYGPPLSDPSQGFNGWLGMYLEIDNLFWAASIPGTQQTSFAGILDASAANGSDLFSLFLSAQWQTSLGYAGLDSLAGDFSGSHTMLSSSLLPTTNQTLTGSGRYGPGRMRGQYNGPGWDSWSFEFGSQFDTVRIFAVPEPSSVALLLGGLAIMVVRRQFGR